MRKPICFICIHSNKPQVYYTTSFRIKTFALFGLLRRCFIYQVKCFGLLFRGEVFKILKLQKYSKSH